MNTIEAKYKVYKAISNNLAAKKEEFKDFDHYIAYCEYKFDAFSICDLSLLKSVFLHFCTIAFGKKY